MKAINMKINEKAKRNGYSMKMKISVAKIIEMWRHS
jgi:hypothetical protein